MGCTFAQGQMLGDIGLKTRGWGNVSVENNHIDVFVFDFADVLRWLAEEYSEQRFADLRKLYQPLCVNCYLMKGTCAALPKSVIIPKWFSILIGIMGKTARDIIIRFCSRMDGCFFVGTLFARAC